ncbi:hypothetical protein [uncultured Propionibacterium sp.]|uniref:hypothetical protein n=1 Tax=uncultured Propionibacterium sp. TaxID=218066 RepID=UPI00292E8028|nr:hypothetical protein [uncultured Propionibacterium sp.]
MAGVEIVISFTVLPFYAQIWLFDSTTKNIPEMGEELGRVVANENVVMIFTQPDTDGDVEVSVGSTNDDTSGTLIYRGKMNFLSGVARVGSIAAADLYDINLNQNKDVYVAIYASSLESPSKIEILFSSDNTIKSIERVVL